MQHLQAFNAHGHACAVGESGVQRRQQARIDRSDRAAALPAGLVVPGDSCGKLGRVREFYVTICQFHWPEKHLEAIGNLRVFRAESRERGLARGIVPQHGEAICRKRRYEGAFVSKLNDAEVEAAETQTWLDFALECGYMSEDMRMELWNNYDHVIGKLVNLIYKPNLWILSGKEIVS